LPDGRDATHDSPFGQNAVQDTHDLFPSQAILRRIKARTSDVFQGKATFTVAATEPLDFPAAERALAIVQ
jgi:hypothetical protein